MTAAPRNPVQPLAIAGILLLISVGCGREPEPFPLIISGADSDQNNANIPESTDTAGNENDTASSPTAEIDTSPALATNEIASLWGSPSIQGSLAEGEWQLTHTASQLLEGGGTDVIQFGSCWDNAYLYVGIRVTDAVLMNDSAEPWNDDAVEVFIDGDNSKSTTYDSHDIQYMVVQATQDLRVTVDRPRNVIYGVNTLEDGYSVEFAIPWGDLGITPVVGLQIGLDVGAHDDDNGAERDAHYMWQGTDDNWTDTSRFGIVRLTMTPVS